VKIIPLLTSESKTDTVPEPVTIEKALHEAKVQFAINGLSNLRKYAIPSGHTGFNGAKRLAVLQGPYPERLLDEWDAWELGKRTENSRPGINPLHYLF